MAVIRWLVLVLLDVVLGHPDVVLREDMRPRADAAR